MRYDPKEYLSSNFQLQEFECNDGSEIPLCAIKSLKKLCKNLEIIREVNGNNPLIIGSGYRTISWNEKVGGSKNSQHLLGKAADFRIKNVSTEEVYKNTLQLIKEQKITAGGLAYYDKQNFIHYDIRGEYATWKT